MKHILTGFCFVIICMACDRYGSARHSEISFSSDTVYFDTVFTTIGSVTHEFRAINHNKAPVLLDRIYLGGGSSSPFRLNINGKPGNEADDIVIPSGDSIFIFVDVNIDPGDKNNPVAIYDSVVFVSGTNMPKVILEAWGQDIWLLKDSVISGNVWNDEKPYVIYGSLTVDTSQVLRMEANTKVYFHHNASMTVAGSLITSGNETQPVIIASDRITSEYEDVPGQWWGINFLDCSRNNKLSGAIIRNAVTGVTLKDGPEGNPDIQIIDSKIMHNSVGSVYASGASLFSVNSVFAHTGFSTVSVNGIGEYRFIHCTVENIWEYDFRTVPSFYVGKDNGVLPSVMIVNSVITGSRDNEMSVDASPAEVDERITADSSMIKLNPSSNSWWNSNSFIEVNLTGKPLFIDESNYDFRPDTLSPLIDNAGRRESIDWPYDIRRKPRPTGKGCDIGAYERQPGEKRKRTDN